RRSTTSRFPCPAVHARSVPQARAGPGRAFARSEPRREHSEPGYPASWSIYLFGGGMAARSPRSSRTPLLTFAFDENADDRIVGGIMLGRHRRDLSLDALPRAVFEQIGVGVRGHAGHFRAIAAARALVGGAHQRA